MGSNPMWPNSKKREVFVSKYEEKINKAAEASAKLFAEKHISIIEAFPKLWKFFCFGGTPVKKPNEEDVFNVLMEFWKDRKFIHINENLISCHANGHIQIEEEFENKGVCFSLIICDAYAWFEGEKLDQSYSGPDGD
jgi:hypothetical protein